MRCTLMHACCCVDAIDLFFIMCWFNFDGVHPTDGVWYKVEDTCQKIAPGNAIY